MGNKLNGPNSLTARGNEEKGAMQIGFRSSRPYYVKWQGCLFAANIPRLDWQSSSLQDPISQLGKEKLVTVSPEGGRGNKRYNRKVHLR